MPPGSKGPLLPPIDSTSEWHARKHGGTEWRVRRKIHLGIDEPTLELRAVEMTGRHIEDAPVLPDLPDRIPPEVEIGNVTADGACDTHKCHETIAVGRMP